MEAKNELIVFVASIILGAAYICGILVTITNIEYQRRRYINKCEGIVSTKWHDFLVGKKNLIATFGGLLFPLYWCFIGGCYFGKRIYNILIDNKDENRVASWVV